MKRRGAMGLTLGGGLSSLPACLPACLKEQPAAAAPPASRPAPREGEHLVPVCVEEGLEIRTMVGLRPYRPSGLVVRREEVSGKILVHNYGHGGGGMSLSWGSAKLALHLAQPVEGRDCAVIGAGVILHVPQDQDMSGRMAPNVIHLGRRAACSRFPPSQPAGRGSAGAMPWEIICGRPPTNAPSRRQAARFPKRQRAAAVQSRQAWASRNHLPEFHHRISLDTSGGGNVRTGSFRAFSGSSFPTTTPTSHVPFPSQASQRHVARSRRQRQPRGRAVY